MRSAAGDPVTLFLCGDVMLGRGVDQILPHPGDPALEESSVRDARAYVELAEAANGPIPRPVGYSWPWGDALEVLDEAAPDVRVLNLETSVTRGRDFAPGKQVHYRMNPANLPALAVARPDVCVLANNHVLDFGVQGLTETLDALAEAGLDQAGAGRDEDEARRPAVVALPGGGRVLVFAVAMPSSGVPGEWAAARDRPGWPSCRGRPATPRRRRSSVSGRPGGRGTSWSSPSIGVPTGATKSRTTRSSSRTRWSRAASISSTATPLTILARPRCTGTG
ncbi:hypothetical protein GCM10027612_72870 [Microbispora bryophytorum subsp. camponoti]